MKIGLLGGTRFIGYHLIWELHRQGYEIAVFNRRLTQPPGPFPPNIEWFCGNRNCPKDLYPFFYNEYDAVIDLSGFLLHHVEPIVRQYHTRIKHYIFCSTSSVYALPPPCPHHELSPRTKAARTYGGDKALVEDLLFELYKEHKWPITILRPQGVFGYYDAYQASFTFHRICHSIPIAIGPKHDVKINFLYVQDLVHAFLLAMNDYKSHGNAYNVAGEDITSQLEFIELCGKVCNCKPKLHFVNDPTYNNLTIGIPWLSYNLVADTSKIKRDLGITFTPLETALSETWTWLRHHPNHFGRYWLRGERRIIRNRPIPKWIKICWKLIDIINLSRWLALFSTLKRLFRGI